MGVGTWVSVMEVLDQVRCSECAVVNTAAL